MTPVQVRRLAAYRACRRIRPIKDFDPDIRLGYAMRCENDHLTIHPNHGRGAPWRHDVGEVARLARLERGEPEWPA